ncbi:MAG: ion transporter [Pseudobacteriovorax sp.]|nr:ion transporter [Pseudobacteriovorax sp.]
MTQHDEHHLSPFREKLYLIIFEADTKAGKLFDIALLWAIVLSVAAVILESVEEIRFQYGGELRTIEWIFTGLFCIEYLVRIYAVRRPFKYIFSFFGIVDLMAMIPTFLGLFIYGSHSLLVVRALRLLRVFRIFKLGRYTGEASTLLAALRASRPKITVFLGGVLGTVLLMGSLMYLIEGEESGFTSIPRAVYWAIVTMTTVGYGDLVPRSDLGQFIASIIMICGYGILAVPTGIVSVELANAERLNLNKYVCEKCHTKSHNLDAIYCYKCGHKMFDVEPNFRPPEVRS